MAVRLSPQRVVAIISREIDGTLLRAQEERVRRRLGRRSLRSVNQRLNDEWIS